MIEIKYISGIDDKNNVNKIVQTQLTPTIIPIEMSANKIANSYWLFTGVQYFTIDKTQTIPNAKKIFVLITVTTTKIVAGNIKDKKIVFLLNKYRKKYPWEIIRKIPRKDYTMIEYFQKIKFV